MSEPLEISEEILQLLQDQSLRDAEAMRERLQQILNRDKPKCNKCGTLIQNPSRWNNIQAEIHWGYESTGKDTDCDIWNLCEKCTSQFRIQHHPICCMCRRTITEVMASLDSRNPHHLYYGDFPAALQRVSQMDHCGLEYAEIEGRIICEECYEDFLGTFSIPLVAGSYGIWDGEHRPGDGFQRADRIQEALQHREIQKDSISTHYSAWLSWSELLEVKRSPERHTRIIHLSTRVDSPDCIRTIKSDDPDCQPTVYAQTGDNQFYSLPKNWLQNLASIAGKTYDPTKLAVTDHGQMLHFGFSLPTEVVIKEGARFKNARD